MTFEDYLRQRDEEEIFLQALTAKSYKNKDPDAKTNENLAVYGDALYKFALCRILFDSCEKERKNLTEVKKKYESDASLMRLAKTYRLLDRLRFDKEDSKIPQNYAAEEIGNNDDEETKKRKKRTLESHKYIAQAMEAMFAAVYVDSGNVKVVENLAKEWKQKLDELDSAENLTEKEEL